MARLPRARCAIRSVCGGRVDVERRAMNIYQRINEVRKAVESITKDKKVEGYMAVTHDNVTALTREHFVTHGVVIIPRLLSERTVPVSYTHLRAHETPE